jgi:hypothetical protein
MGLVVLSEKAVLDQFEARWRDQGYKLVREPSQEELPDFLKGFRPDAIAVGQKPSLVIEIIGKRGKAANLRIQKLNDLFDDNQEWHLEVVYLSPETELLTPVEQSIVRKASHQARIVCETDPRAGLLWAWSTLEAITRNLEPELANSSLGSFSVIEVLVSNGHVSQSDGKKLRSLAKKRNAIAHGQVDVEPEKKELEYLLELIEHLTE